MRLHFFLPSSSVNGARSSLIKRRLPVEGPWKGIKLKTFRRSHVISLSGVVVRRSRVYPEVPGLSPSQYFSISTSFFFAVFVLLFFL